MTKKAQQFALLSIMCVAAYALYAHFGPKRSALPILRPTLLPVTARPQPGAVDLEKRFPEAAPSQVAIFLTRADPSVATPARCLSAMGVPFFVTRDLRAALRHRLVLLFPDVDGHAFDTAQAGLLNDFVARGGVLFAQNVFWGGIKSLFGFEDFTPLRTRHTLAFAVSDPSQADPIFGYLNRREEQEVPLGSPKISEIIWTNGYRPSAGTKVLGRFEDGSAAVLKHDFGKGHTYLVGVSLTDVVLRSQQNRDYEAQRVYVNGFEPGADVWLLILRAWYETYSESGIRLGTIPHGKRSVLMLSHDVDWEYSFQPMVAFARFEKEAGTSSTFFVQTKYLDDSNSHAFFFGTSLDVLRKLTSGGSDVESHTVIHSTLFNKVPLGTGEERYPTYRSRATRNNPAQDTTALGEVCVSKSLLDGELPGHHTVFFRAGHLRVPPYLPEALVRCGYEFDSSFTAGDVLSNFPFELNLDLGLTEASTIFEFPVTFEDEQLPPLVDRLAPLLNTIEANAENGAPSVLLVHTNNSQDKLAAERGILSRLPNDILVESMIDYARFWKARSLVRWSAHAFAGGDEIELDPELPISGLTVVSSREVKSATGVEGLLWSGHQVILPDLNANSHVVVRVTYARK